MIRLQRARVLLLVEAAMTNVCASSAFHGVSIYPRVCSPRARAFCCYVRLTRIICDGWRRCSCIGIARTHIEDCIGVESSDGLDSMAAQLVRIQSRLMDVGSAIATPVVSRVDGEDGTSASASTKTKTKNIGFDEDGDEVQLLEGYIDEMDARLPPLKNFILPSGGHAGNAPQGASYTQGEGNQPRNTTITRARLQWQLTHASVLCPPCSHAPQRAHCICADRYVAGRRGRQRFS